MRIFNFREPSTIAAELRAEYERIEEWASSLDRVYRRAKGWEAYLAEEAPTLLREVFAPALADEFDRISADYFLIDERLERVHSLAQALGVDLNSPGAPDGSGHDGD